MKKTSENISLFELIKLKYKKKLLLKELNALPSSPLPNFVLSKVTKGSGKPPSNEVDDINVVLIRYRSNSHTPPFLLIYEINNKNLHNFLKDSGASSIIILASIYSKLNIET